MLPIEMIYKKLIFEDGEATSQNVKSIIKLLLFTAYKNCFGDADNFIVNCTDETIQMFELKTVVENVYSERLEIELKDAKNIQPNCKLGDRLQINFDGNLLSTHDILKATSIVYKTSNDSEKDSIIESIQLALEGSNFNSKIIPKTQPSTGKWVSYFEPYKPYHHPSPSTSADEETELRYGSGYYDSGVDPFPFSSYGGEDDYGDDSWS